MRYVAFVCLSFVLSGDAVADEPAPLPAEPSVSCPATCPAATCSEAERIRHLFEAAAHLAAAGRHDDATRLRSEAEGARQRLLTAKLAELASLHAEIERLRAAHRELAPPCECAFAGQQPCPHAVVRPTKGEDVTLNHPNVTEYWDLSLDEAIRTALANAKVLRNLGGMLFTPCTQNNQPSNQFPGNQQSDIEAEVRHPLLQGAGFDFNIPTPDSNAGIFAGQATNGPVQNPNCRRGTDNGMVLARINVDISLADFEAGVRNFCGDLERAYWDLYYHYRNLEAVQAGRDGALRTWHKVQALRECGAKGGESEKEAQASEQYHLFRAQVENSLGLLYTAESRLRYMMGLAPADGRLVRPKDKPTTAEVKFDWKEILPEALNRGVELRKQKEVVKLNEMILIASRNYLMSHDRWDDVDGQTKNWSLGPFTVTMPIGLRLAMASIKNAELTLAASRALLQDQELELTHLMTNSVRDLDRNYRVSVTTFNRRVAAAQQVNAVESAVDAGTATLDMLLDAQRRLADAEITYHRALVDYNVAIMQIHFRKNSLLEYNGIQLAEQPWPRGRSTGRRSDPMAVVRQSEAEDDDAELSVLVRPRVVEPAPELNAEFSAERARYDAPDRPSSRREPHSPRPFLAPSYQTPIRR
ncbi:MAG TPA: TolC family protein [Pirellulales bacterium]|nr:TolC family protein [Pirellulales bacterium]